MKHFLFCSVTSTYTHTHPDTYLSEFRRSGAVHRDCCYGDPGDSWGEKEKQDFLNSRGTLSEGGRAKKLMFLHSTDIQQPSK